MKCLLQGIQAVTVELLGVLLIVWMLFGFTAMGLGSAGNKSPTFRSDVAQQFVVWKEQLSTRLFRPAPLDAKRQQYVANRLGYFSQEYSQAARKHVDGLMSELDRTTLLASQNRSPSE